MTALLPCALLGTDRRDPPPLDPGLVADVVDDALAESAPRRLLTAVAAATVAHRAGLRPGRSRAPLQPAGPDPRPLLPPAAARRWHHLVDHWPELEDEWLEVAMAAGWRPPPDVLVAMLRRARAPRRREAVLRFGAARAAWLVDHAPTVAAPAGGAVQQSADALAAIPAELRAGFDLPAGEFAAMFVAGLGDGTYRWAHRAVLRNTVATMPARHLSALLTALRVAPAADGRAADTAAAPSALWESVTEIATVRATMLEELAPAGTDPLLPPTDATS